MRAIWIEIPVADLPRAARFYREVFGHAETDVIDDGTRAITIIAGEPSVSLNRTAGFSPAASGPLPYFGVDEPIADVLARVTAAGGTVAEAATPRGDLGLFALVHDTEGNHLTIHGAR